MTGPVVAAQGAASRLLLPLLEPRAIALHGLPQDGQQAGLGRHLPDDAGDGRHGHVARRPFAGQVARQARELPVVPLLLLRCDGPLAHAIEQVQLLATDHGIDLGMRREERPPPRRASLVDPDADEVRRSDRCAVRDRRGLTAAALRFPARLPTGRPTGRLARLAVRLQVTLARLSHHGQAAGVRSGRRGCRMGADSSRPRATSCPAGALGSTGQGGVRDDARTSAAFVGGHDDRSCHQPEAGRAAASGTPARRAHLQRGCPATAAGALHRRRRPGRPLRGGHRGLPSGGLRRHRAAGPAGRAPPACAKAARHPQRGGQLLPERRLRGGLLARRERGRLHARVRAGGGRARPGPGHRPGARHQPRGPRLPRGSRAVRLGQHAGFHPPARLVDGHPRLRQHRTAAAAAAGALPAVGYPLLRPVAAGCRHP